MLAGCFDILRALTDIATGITRGDASAYTPFMGIKLLWVTFRINWTHIWF